MRLTLHTDYAFRVLLYLRVAGRRATASEIAEAFGISLNHVQKVMQSLNKAGFLDSVRGRGGGVQLAKPEDEIVLGDVVRVTEPDLNLVECLNPETNTCPIAGVCALEHILEAAGARFLEYLDGFTLADLGRAPKGFRERLGISI